MSDEQTPDPQPWHDGCPHFRAEWAAAFTAAEITSIAALAACSAEQLDALPVQQLGPKRAAEMITWAQGQVSVEETELGRPFTKRPVTIHAMEWTGENFDTICAFVGEAAVIVADVLTIKTLEGTMQAKVGDFIIRGVRGEFYPCDREIFEATYGEPQDADDEAEKLRARIEQLEAQLGMRSPLLPAEGRMLSTHIADAQDHALHILVGPEGAGGAPMVYLVQSISTRLRVPLPFQSAPIPEVGVNGLTNEVLLAIVADRLRCFQAGPFPCSHNGQALQKTEEALRLLHQRTADRRRRQVEGQHRS